MIREIIESDLDLLLELYSKLHNNVIPPKSESLMKLWQNILNNKNQHIVVIEEQQQIVSSCVCTIIPNLTHNQRPYAVIENVITDNNFRKCGMATACLNYAKEIAIKNNCYKIMLLSGSKEESTLNFYEKAGYNRKDKTGFIQWL